MSKELLAKAEKVFNYAGKVLAFPERLNASQKKAMEDIYEVAQDVLATVHADDDEPVAPQKLLDIGFVLAQHYHPSVPAFTIGDTSREHWGITAEEDDFWLFHRLDADGFDGSENCLCEVRTAGHLRRLLKDLLITSK